MKACVCGHCTINAYLSVVHVESLSRGYHFDRSKVGPVRTVQPIAITSGQIRHDWAHLLQKLSARSPSLFDRWRYLGEPACHHVSLNPGSDGIMGEARRWRLTAV